MSANTRLAPRPQADVARAWKHIFSGHVFTDLDPALLGRVEELIDFVTQEPPPD